MRDDFREIRIAQICVKSNVRRGESDVADLVEDIRAHGLINPILVQRSGDGYELIAGHRRLAACKALGMERIAAVVTDGHDCARLDLQLAENIQRKDLSAYEIGQALRKMRDRVDSITELACRVRKSYPYVFDHLGYADLWDDLRAQGIDDAMLARIPYDSLKELKNAPAAERADLLRSFMPTDPACQPPTRAKIRSIIDARRAVPRKSRRAPLVFAIHQYDLVLTLEFRTKLDVRRVVQMLLERGGVRA